MKKLSKVLALLLVAAMALVACQNTPSSSGGTDSNNQTSSNGPVDPEAKYPEPITVRYALQTNAADATVIDPTNTDEENNWTRLYEEKYNIKTEIMWKAVSNNNQYQTKLDLAIATKALPDVINTANYAQFIDMVDGEMLQPLDYVYENYLSERCKTLDMYDGGLKHSFGVIDGKLMGLSQESADWNNARQVFIRADWMEELGYEAPKSMDDVIEIAKGFVDKGKAQFALPLNKILTTDTMDDIQGIANAYGGYPRMWISDGNGGLKYGSIQPEVKKTLELYNELYEGGYIDPAFASLDGNANAQQLTQGKIGVIIGAFWLPTWPLNSLYEEKGVDWNIYPVMPFEETGRSSVQIAVKSPKGAMLCVNKDFKYPEALMKMLNENTAKLEDTDVDVQKTYHSYQVEKNGETVTVGVFGLTPMRFYFADPMTNINTNTHVTDAIDKNDESYLISAHDHVQYENTKLYADKIKAGEKPTAVEWVAGKLFYGPNSCYGVLNSYYQGLKDPDRYMPDQTGGYKPESYVKYGGTLEMMEDTAFVNMISGTQGSSLKDGEFEKYVQQWKDGGGENMTIEYNEWFKTLGDAK